VHSNSVTTPRSAKKASTRPRPADSPANPPTPAAAAPEEEASVFATTEELIAEIRAGRLVIITDDESRENEGDLVGAAQTITAEQVNFMVTEGRGMLCVPVSVEIARRLGLDDMVPNNRDAYRTHFTVTVDAAVGVSTGISAADRARTIALLAHPTSKPTDFTQPGHVNPLVAKRGGVLRRAGHTEAAVDLARLAGHHEAGVLIEIMNADGTMARLPDLKHFALKHRLKMGTIAQLIQWRRQQERLIERVEIVDMPTDYGTFKLHLYRTTLDDIHHLALVKGEIRPDTPTLVRVHSECLTGDIFGSRRCDCGTQLHAAMAQIDAAGHGVLLYMRQHEGRGIGLVGKIKAYKLQEQGYDTVDANLKLGYPMDLRDYGMGAQILHDLGVRQIRLMTNNPRKIVGLGGHHLEIIERVAIQSPAVPENEKYLATKKRRMGHLL
jgi:3,4-dihydroxy 2-butanone 4-phosphate synthase / GTP cyclohydrolase II